MAESPQLHTKVQSNVENPDLMSKKHIADIFMDVLAFQICIIYNYRVRKLSVRAPNHATEKSELTAVDCTFNPVHM